MHRILYISLFTFLGALLSFIIHAGLEMLVIHFLLLDFTTFGFGLSWEQWYALHSIGSVALLIMGILFGFWQGKHWYGIIYLKHSKLA